MFLVIFGPLIVDHQGLPFAHQGLLVTKLFPLVTKVFPLVTKVFPLVSLTSWQKLWPKFEHL